MSIECKKHNKKVLKTVDVRINKLSIKLHNTIINKKAPSDITKIRNKIKDEINHILNILDHGTNGIVIK